MRLRSAEFAPRSPYLREGLPHIAEAAERDRAKTAAHDEALRLEFRGLPTAPPQPPDRQRLAMTAAQIAPPDYITNALGSKPGDPAKRKSWERGVEAIETYRHKHGIKDRRNALGPRPAKAAERAARERAQRRIEQAQRSLGRTRQLARSRALGIGR